MQVVGFSLVKAVRFFFNHSARWPAKCKNHLLKAVSLPPSGEHNVKVSAAWCSIQLQVDV